MAVAATGTFLTTATAGHGEAVRVLIAARDLRPGDEIVAGDVRLVDVALPGDVGGLFGSVDAAVGRQVTAAVDRGEFLNQSATSSLTEGADTMEMTLTVPVERSVAGLRSGDHVDVFATWNGAVTEVVAAGARVLSTSGSDPLLPSSTVSMRLAVDSQEQIEALVHAQAAGEVTVTRAPADGGSDRLGRRYSPRAEEAR